MEERKRSEMKEKKERVRERAREQRDIEPEKKQGHNRLFSFVVMVDLKQKQMVETKIISKSFYSKPSKFEF